MNESLAAARQSDDAWSIARALNALAVLVGYRDDFERAEALWEESLELGRKLGDRRTGEGRAPEHGVRRADRGDFELAGALFEEGLAMSRESKDPNANSLALLGLGIVETRRGEYGRAKTLLEECLVLSRKLGSMVIVAEGLETLAEMAGASGDGTAGGATVGCCRRPARSSPAPPGCPWKEGCTSPTWPPPAPGWKKRTGGRRGKRGER